MTTPRALLLSAASALAGALIVLACVDVRTLELTFGDQGEGLDGFLCRDTAGDFLLERVIVPTGGFNRLNLVVDFVSLDQGVPGCRGAQIIAWCASHDCTPLPRRVCVPYDAPPSLSIRTDTIQNLRFDLNQSIFGSGGALDGVSLTGDAPQGTTLIRTVATLEPCDSLLTYDSGAKTYPSFDVAQLVGCAYSSPVSIGSARGEVFLGFEQAAVSCTEQQVTDCANSFNLFQ